MHRGFPLRVGPLLHQEVGLTDSLGTMNFAEHGNMHELSTDPFVGHSAFDKSMYDSKHVYRKRKEERLQNYSPKLQEANGVWLKCNPIPTATNLPQMLMAGTFGKACLS